MGCGLRLSPVSHCSSGWLGLCSRANAIWRVRLAAGWSKFGPLAAYYSSGWSASSWVLPHRSREQTSERDVGGRQERKGKHWRRRGEGRRAGAGWGGLHVGE